MAGFIIWEGPSLLDGSPLVAVALYSTSNRKTGGMVQTYILRADVDPVSAVASGADAAICGDCPHRGDGTGKGRSCYVFVGQGPLAVYRAYKRGRYPVATAADVEALTRGRTVRLGTYGDPMAAPAYIWEGLTAAAKGWTGYTHAWRTVAGADAARWAALLMASVETAGQAAEAVAAGWRYYRTRQLGEVTPAAEIDCPSARGVLCADCGLCSGTARAAARSVSIEIHGGTAAATNGARLIARLTNV